MPEQTPEKAVRAYDDAFNSGDLDALMAFYEPGAALVPQPGQVASGAAAIREAMGGILALKGHMEIEPGLTVVQAGDIARACEMSSAEPSAASGTGRIWPPS